jgi:hypothetical protein
MHVEGWVTAVIAVVGVVIALVQLRSGLKANRVQRVIDLHRDLTTGEVGQARDRFMTLMWKHGERVSGRNVCHRPQWVEILPSVLGERDVSRGLLGAYDPEDRIAEHASDEPMRDLYAVLWCFERIEAGRAGRALDTAMLAELVAHHAAWWKELTRNLTEENTRHVRSLRSLADALSTPSVRDWASADFVMDP